MSELQELYAFTPEQDNLSTPLVPQVYLIKIYVFKNQAYDYLKGLLPLTLRLRIVGSSPSGNDSGSTSGNTFELP